MIETLRSIIGEFLGNSWKHFLSIFDSGLAIRNPIYNMPFALYIVFMISD